MKFLLLLTRVRNNLECCCIDDIFEILWLLFLIVGWVVPGILCYVLWQLHQEIQFSSWRENYIKSGSVSRLSRNICDLVKVTLKSLVYKRAILTKSSFNKALSTFQESKRPPLKVHCRSNKSGWPFWHLSALIKQSLQQFENRILINPAKITIYDGSHYRVNFQSLSAVL